MMMILVECIVHHFQPPKNNIHMFGSWLRNFIPSLRSRIMLGLMVMCWLWLNRNDIVLDKKNLTHTGNFTGDNDPGYLKRKRGWC
jgi:hypothetical protein